MSLNGLDATAVTEAYQSALGEGGAWLLIRYVSRDEVDLLGRGSGGLSEVNDAVKRYEELSPLYGFINYRRRKVVLKYVPEGTSRLLQARVVVHFQFVVERLTPHDTIFSFATFSELKDSKLSSACSLHTASASIKSSSDSLRPPVLSEIAEDAQESQSSTAGDHDVNRARGYSTGSEHARSRTASFQEATDRRDSSNPRSAKQTPSPPQSTRTIRNTNKALPPTPAELSHERKNSASHGEESRHDRRQSIDARSSFQSDRPPTRDLPSPYEYKPKVKLGPRPSIDSASRSLNSDSPRPISSLPASVRMPTRKALPTRPKSQHPQKSKHPVISPKTNLSPPLPVLPINISDRSPEVKIKTTTSPTPVTQPKSPLITPEKRRLMKALQIRQKQLAAKSSATDFDNGSSKETVPGEGGLMSESLTEQSHESELHHLAEKNTNGGSELEQSLNDTNPASLDNTESSPISIQDLSDVPSTQASSITEEEESGVLETVKAGSNPGFPSGESRNTVQKGDLSQHASEDTATPEENRESAAESPLSIIHIDLDSSAPVKSQTPASNLITIDRELSPPDQVPLPPVDDDEESSLSRQRSSLEMASKLMDAPSTKSRQSLDSDVTDRPRDNDEESNITHPSTSDMIGDLAVDKAHRRPGLALSLRASSPENSDDHFLSDDSFMEELRSATVQEAKPVSVSISKSPITPVFPRFLGEDKSQETQASRSVSNPFREGSKDDLLHPPQRAPQFLATRSYSASHTANTQPQQASAIVLKKVGVSSGISQRIKALEKLSSRPASPSSQGGSNSSTTVTSPTFVTLRKASLKTPPATDSTPSTFSRSRQKMSSLSPSLSPNADPALQSDKLVDTAVEGKLKKSRPESISVTATIIRDSSNRIPKVPINPSEPSVLDLHESPLMVEHQSTEMPPPRSPRKQPKSRLNSTRSLSSSSIDRKSEPSQASRRDSFASRRSVTSGRGSEVDLPRSISDTSLNRANGNDGLKEEKKESRKSRLLKRMSGISSASRRSIVHVLNPLVKEEPLVEHRETIYAPPPPMADFGDVNIQFPDTLLWKRRNMKIDDQGSLVLSPSKTDNNSRTITKRYSLSEFHAPYSPDQDRQELPNSVILDFKDGSTLQVACETSSAQAELMKSLKAAYSIYSP